MFRKFALAAVVLCVAASLSVVSAFADQPNAELKVTDCAGEARFGAATDVGKLHQLEIMLDQAAADGLKQGSQIVLINKSNGERVEAELNSNTAIFKEVAAGSWKLCLSNGKSDQFIKFSEIAMLDSAASNKIAAAGASGSGIIAVSSIAALTAGGIAASSSSSSSRAGVGAAQETAPAAQPAQAAAASSSFGFNDDDYPLGAPAKPLSPFS